VGLGVSTTQRQPQPGTVVGWVQGAVDRSQRPVEHDLVDAGVVVEVLDVAQVGRHAGDVGVQRLPAVRRERRLMSRASGRDAQPLGDSSTAPHVSLQHVDRMRLEHVLEVTEVVAVLAGGDVERQRLSKLREALQVVARTKV
jgi:hypothetical protein